MATTKTFKLASATLSKTSDSNLIKVTNHQDNEFHLTLDQLKGLNQAFQSLRAQLWDLADQVQDEEDTMRKEVKAIDVCTVDTSIQWLRVVVRKSNKRLYLSAGLYQKTRLMYIWVRELTMRLDLFDNLTQAIQYFEKKEDTAAE